MTAIVVRTPSERIDRWTSLELHRSITDLAWTVELETFDRWSPEKRLIGVTTYDPLTVTLDDQLVFTGHVYTTDLSYTATSHNFHVGGRSLSAAAVDCSTPAKTWRGKSLSSIAREILKPFDLAVNVDSAAQDAVGQTFREVAAEDGERIYDLLVRLARYRAVLITTDEVGDIVFTKAQERVVPGVVIQQGAGRILEATISRDGSDRFSQYTTKAQLPSGQLDTIEPRTISASVSDAGVPLYRPITLMPDGHETRAGLRTRAAWERNVRVGKSATVEYTLRGWSARPGHLWRPNDLIKINDLTLGVQRDLLVVEVTFRLDSGAETTDLKLMHPSAFLAEKTPVPKKKDDGVSNFL